MFLFEKHSLISNSWIGQPFYETSFKTTVDEMGDYENRKIDALPTKKLIKCSQKLCGKRALETHGINRLNPRLFNGKKSGALHNRHHPPFSL